MNKALQEYARKSGCTLDNERKAVYGTISGFYIILTEQTKQQVELVFNVNSENNMLDKKQITDFLEILKSGNSAITYQGLNGYKISIYIKAFKTEQAEIIADIVNRIADFLQTLEMKGCCQYCGDTVDAGLSAINGKINVLCSNCFYKVKDTAKEPEKGNLLLGIIGAILGSLLGVVVWVAIYQIGFIAGIAGFLMFYAAFQGYQKLGKRNDMTGIVISIIISVFMLVFAEILCILIAMVKEYSMLFGYTIFDCIYLLPRLFKIPNAMAQIIKELFMGYLLMAFATVSSIRQCAKQTVNRKEALRL